jgi:hypothetical protein
MKKEIVRIASLSILVISITVACTSCPSPTSTAISTHISQTVPSSTLKPVSTVEPSPKANQPESTAAPTISPPTVEPSPKANQPESTATPTVPSQMVKQVTTKVVFRGNFWWADDQTLYYAIGERASNWWSYYVQDDIAKALKTPPLQPGSPSPDVLAEMPEGATSISASPSGQKVLYVVELVSTPTPDPEAAGEPARISIPSELWLLESGTSRRVGAIENCVEAYLWSDDEHFTIAQGWDFTTCQGDIWLANLETLQVRSLVSGEEEWLEVIDISPLGQKILLRSKTDGRLYILDVDSSQTESLDLAQWAWGNWLDEQHLVVGENSVRGGARWVYNMFWLYDTEYHKRVQVLDTDIVSALSGQEFAYLSLSPDRQWLAFVVGDDLLGSLGAGEIWVMQVNPDN